MEDGKEPGRHDGEDGHGLGRTIHGGTPPGPEEVEDGGDERARMPDPDPEHEGGDVELPVLRRANAGDTEPEVDLIRPRDDADRAHQPQHGPPGEVASWRRGGGCLPVLTSRRRRKPSSAGSPRHRISGPSTPTGRSEDASRMPRFA